MNKIDIRNYDTIKSSLDQSNRIMFYEFELKRLVKSFDNSFDTMTRIVMNMRKEIR